MLQGWKWLAALALAPLSALLVSASPTSADVLMPGQKMLSYCFEISNLAEYPDYVFIVNFAEPIGGHQIIEPGKCFQFYKLARPVIYAILKAGFNPSEIPNASGDKAAEKKYFDTNPKMLKSDVKVFNPGAVDEKDPRSEVVDVLKITGMDGQKLNIQKDSVRYTYTNGARETLPYVSQDDFPVPKAAPAPPYLYGLIAVPVLAALGLGFLFLRRRRAS
jgi:MYXO-CTERM domain-containing protein